jgi:hypothetical protein
LFRPAWWTSHKLRSYSSEHLSFISFPNASKFSPRPGRITTETFAV